MKINNSKLNDILATVLRKTEAHPKPDDARTLRNQQPIKDTVDISGKREIVSGLVEKVKQVSEVREDKVKEIKSAIENGEYRIDAQTVARNILREGILNEIV